MTDIPALVAHMQRKAEYAKSMGAKAVRIDGSPDALLALCRAVEEAQRQLTENYDESVKVIRGLEDRVETLCAALLGVIRVADRETVEFAVAREALKREALNPPPTGAIHD